MLMPGLRMKLWPIYSVQKFPWVQVPGGRDRRGDRAGGCAAADRREERRVPIGVRQLLRPRHVHRRRRPEGRAAAGAAARHADADPSGRVPRPHPRAGVRRPGVAGHRRVDARQRRHARRPRASGSRRRRSGSWSSRPRARRHDRHRDRARGRAAAVGRHREPARRLRRRRRDGGGRGHRGASASETDARIIEVLLGNKNNEHNNYQDLQAFLDNGGKIGLQHDPLLYGAYLLNPFLVRVEMVPMLVVNQGEVAVIKAFVGLPTLDTSGSEFKFGSIVSPGHRGIWREPLRTGKYPINPRCYAAEIVPTSILTLNWSKETSASHNLDANLAPIEGEEPRGLRLLDRAAGADPRARHQGAEGHLDGRHDAQPRERGAAVGGRQPLPQHAAGPAGGHVHRDAHAGAAGRARARDRVPAALRGGDQGRLHPERALPGGARGGAHQARDREPGEGHLRGDAARPDRPHRDGEGQGHRRHAGRARQRTGGGRDREEPGGRPARGGDR